jgi:hypothetical protein
MEILAGAGLAGLDLAARSNAGDTPAQIFEQRGEAQELRDAWERLIESVERANRGEGPAETTMVGAREEQHAHATTNSDGGGATERPGKDVRGDAKSATGRVPAGEVEDCDMGEEFYDAVEKLGLDEEDCTTFEHIERVG